MQPELKFHSEAEQKKFYAIGEMVITLTEVYNQPVPTERVLLVWWEALKAIDLTALRRAFNIHVVNKERTAYIKVLRVLENPPLHIAQTLRRLLFPVV